MYKLPPELIPDYGVSTQMSGLISRVVCKNYSPFTYTGTGTYIIGKSSVAVIDPGPLADDIGAGASVSEGAVVFAYHTRY